MTATIPRQAPMLGCRVVVTDGSSDGHTGTVVAVLSRTCVKIRRDADGVEVTVSNFYIIASY